MMTTATDNKAKKTEFKPGTIFHEIFIKLKDSSPAAVQKQLDLGRQYLTNHPGELSFAATVLATGLTRHQQVSYLQNDTDFTVVFHIIFENAQVHNEYQVSPQHVDHFIPLSKSNWEKIRVFDSEIQ
jgi:hypothetical protein